MIISTDKILDKMMLEITEARKAGELKDIQKYAGRIQLLCELLLDEHGDQKDENPSMRNFEKIKPAKRIITEDSGDSLLDF